MADENGKPMHSWRVLILPFIEQQELYAEYDFNEPWNGPNNCKLASRMPRIYRFPGLPEDTRTTSYVAVVGPQTVWPGEKTLSFKDVEEKDGMSETILLAENRGEEIHWLEPRDLSFEKMSFEMNSPNGLSSVYDTPAVVLVDGSVLNLSSKLQPHVLRALLTVDGDERIASDDRTGFKVIPDGRLRPRRDGK